MHVLARRFDAPAQTLTCPNKLLHCLIKPHLSSLGYLKMAILENLTFHRTMQPPRNSQRKMESRALAWSNDNHDLACGQDPYANAYNKHWTDSSAFNDEHRRIGRGGWVATRNYELDSGAYFLNMLWNYCATPGLFAPERSECSRDAAKSKTFHRDKMCCMGAQRLFLMM